MNAPACRAVRTCERLHGGSRHPCPRSDAQPRVAQTDGPWPTAPSVCPLEGHLPLLPPVPTDAPSYLGLKPPEKRGTSRDLLGGSSTQSRSERSWPKTDTGVRAPGPFFLRTQESWPQTLLSQPGRN